MLGDQDVHSDYLGIAFSPNGHWLVASRSDESTSIGNFRSGEPICEFQQHNFAVRGVAFNMNDSRLATASNNGTVKIWDVETGDDLLTPTAQVS